MRKLGRWDLAGVQQWGWVRGLVRCWTKSWDSVKEGRGRMKTSGHGLDWRWLLLLFILMFLISLADESSNPVYSIALYSYVVASCALLAFLYAHVKERGRREKYECTVIERLTEIRDLLRDSDSEQQTPDSD